MAITLLVRAAAYGKTTNLDQFSLLLLTRISAVDHVTVAFRRVLEIWNAQATALLGTFTVVNRDPNEIHGLMQQWDALLRWICNLLVCPWCLLVSFCHVSPSVGYWILGSRILERVNDCEAEFSAKTHKDSQWLIETQRTFIPCTFLLITLL